jgi:hypothetical protein
MLTITTRKHKQMRQKQSLVYKVPSGVAILSHVCGVKANISTLNLKCVISISRKYRETRNSCLLPVKNGMGVAT